MHRPRSFITVVLVLLNALTASLGAPPSNKREVASILKDIEHNPLPQFDRRKAEDQEAVKEFVARREAAIKKREVLLFELYDAEPNHAMLVSLFNQRWDAPPYDAARAAEIDRVMGHTQNSALRAEALFAKTHIAHAQHSDDPKSLLPAIEEFVRSAPKDPRCPNLFYTVGLMAKDASLRLAMEDRIIKDYPDSSVGVSAAARRKARSMIGKPFVLAFKDAITGKSVSMDGLRGKVVVIDFWSTTCGPCVEELPALKDTYVKYKDKGVEFVGISLDRPESEGGLSAVKAFIAKNNVPWPQYYQGGGWESDFSLSWGVDSIPTLFIVAADGTLASVEARDKLDQLIPELIQRRDKSSP